MFSHHEASLMVRSLEVMDFFHNWVPVNPILYHQLQKSNALWSPSPFFNTNLYGFRTMEMVSRLKIISPFGSDLRKLHQHRPQTAPIHASKKVMCNSKFTDHFNCYLTSFIAHFDIHWSEMKSKKEHKKPE